jgi:uncharacterized protein (TIRG00374 family)
MKKFLFFLISLLIGVVLLVWIGKTVGWQEIKNALLVFSGWQGLAIFGLTLLIILIGNWKWQEILRGEETNIAFLNLLKVYLPSFSIKFLAPVILVAAELFQGYALKEKSFLSWSKAMASVIIDRILEWTANLAVIFLGALFFLLTIGPPPVELLIIFGGVFLFFTGGVTYFYFKTFKGESMAKVFGKIFNHRLDSRPLEVEREIFDFFKPKKMAMWKSFGLSFLRVGIMLIRTWLLIIFLGKNIGLLSSLSILGFSYLAIMIPIPMALGSHEAIQTFAFDSLGLGLGTATAFTMIIRGAELLIALAGVVILSQIGIILLKKALFK